MPTKDSLQASTKPGSIRRIWEIDFFRGLALLLMIYFHVVYDMKELLGYNVEYATGLNNLIGKASGTLFIFLSGLSVYLTASNAKRGLRILALALLITLATYLYSPQMVITFGILHFLGVSILLSPAFKKLSPLVLLVLGVAVILWGPVLTGIPVRQDWLFPLGLSTGKITSSDYYPLLPWLGVFLLGQAAGQSLYRDKLSILPFSLPSNPISWAGRHTLAIYLLHQPVIMVVLYLIEKFK